MSKRIPPTGSQKMMLLIHFIVFAIAVVIMWTTYDRGATHWAYPWPAWITAAWGLWVMGHTCVVFRSYQDRHMDKYQKEANGNA